MKGMKIALVLAEAILREQNGGNMRFAYMRQEFLGYPSTSPSNKEERRVPACST